MYWLLVDPKPRNWMLVAGVELMLSHTARPGRPERDDRLERIERKQVLYLFRGESAVCKRLCTSTRRRHRWKGSGRYR
jgi:hypothetical protein